MPHGTDLDEGLVETVKLWVFELVVVEAEEVVHDDVAGQCWKGMAQVQRLLAGFKLLDPDAESVNVSVDDVDEVEDGATGEPGMSVYSVRRLSLNSHGRQRRTTTLVNSRIQSCKYTSLETKLPVPSLLIKVYVLAIKLLKECRIPNM